MFVPQNSIEYKLFEEYIKENSFSTLETGIVRTINTFRDTLEIETDSGQFLKDVRVLQGKAYDLISPKNVPEYVGNIDIDLPVVGTRVLLAFIRGKSILPVVLGCLQDNFDHTRATSLSVQGIDPKDKETITKEINRKFYLHQSHYWEKIDGNGNYEKYLPDGTEISVSDEVVEDVDKLSYKDTYELETTKAAKTVRIKHASGTIVKIEPDGQVTIDTRAAETVAGQKIHMLSNKVYVGSEDSDETEPIPRGESLKILVNNLIAKVNDIDDKVKNHIHPTGVGPSGTSSHIPVTFDDMTDDALSDKSFVDKKV